MTARKSIKGRELYLLSIIHNRGDAFSVEYHIFEHMKGVLDHLATLPPSVIRSVMALVVR